MEEESKRRGRRRRLSTVLMPIFLMLSASIVSGGITTMIKKALEEGLDVFVQTTYRLLVATLFMAPFAFFFERRSRPQLSSGLLAWYFVSALLGSTSVQALFYMGIKFTSATYATALFNLTPVITYLLSLAFREETLSIAKVTGTAVSLGGGMLLTFYKGRVLINSSTVSESGQAADGYSSLTLGSFVLIMGSLSWALWFTLQSKIGKTYRALYTSATFAFFFSFVQSAMIGLLTQRHFSRWILRSKIQVLAVLCGGIFNSGVAFLLNSWCVEKRGPVFPIAFFPVTEVSVAIIEVSFLHEHLHLGLLLGSIIIISGLYILVWGKTKEALNSESQPKSDEKKMADLEGASVDPSSKATIVEGASMDPSSKATIVEGASVDPSSKATIVEGASVDPSSKATIVEDASMDPSSKAIIVEGTAEQLC